MTKQSKGEKIANAVKAKQKALDSGDIVDKQHSQSVGPHDEGFDATAQNSNATNPHEELDED